MRRLAVLSSGTIVAQGLVVAVMPVLTRLYSPETFGFYAAFSSLFGILVVVAALRYDAVIPIAASRREAIEAVWLTLLVTTGTSLLLLLLLWPCRDWLAHWSELEAIPDLLLWLVPGVLLYGFMLAFDGWATYRGTLKVMVASKVGQAVALAFLQLGLGAFLGGPGALVMGLVFSYLIDCLVILWTIGPADRRQLLAIRPRGLLALARRHWRFPIFSAPSAFLDSAGKALPTLLLAILYGPAVAGLYSLAQRAVGLPLRFLGSSASQLYLSEISRNGHSNGALLRSLFMTISRRFLLLGILYLGPLAILGPWLFGLAFGRDWADSGMMVRWMLPMYLTMLVNYPTRSTLLLFQRQSLIFRLDLLSVLGIAVGFVAAWLLQLSPPTTILLFSVLVAVAYGLYWLSTFRLLQRFAGGGAA